MEDSRGVAPQWPRAKWCLLATTRYSRRMRWCWVLALAACSTSPCPSSAPENGAPCTRDESLNGLECEYGGTEHTTCTTLAYCSYGSQLDATQAFWTVDE